MPFLVVLVGDCLDSGLVDESECTVKDINKKKGARISSTPFSVIIQSLSKSVHHESWFSLPSVRMPFYDAFFVG